MILRAGAASRSWRRLGPVVFGGLTGVSSARPRGHRGDL